MADSRYAWSRHSWEENAFELRKRAKADPECIRTLTKDARAKCLVKTCNRIPREGEVCIYPSRTVNADSKVIAHEECVENFCAGHTAKSTKEAVAVTMKAKGVIPPTRKELQPNMVLDTQALIARIKAQLKQQIWEEAYAKGKADALAELMNALGEPDETEVTH